MFHIKYFKIMMKLLLRHIYMSSNDLITSLETTIRIHQLPADRNM